MGNERCSGDGAITNVELPRAAMAQPVQGLNRCAALKGSFCKGLADGQEGMLIALQPKHWCLTTNQQCADVGAAGVGHQQLGVKCAADVICCS